MSRSPSPLWLAAILAIVTGCTNSPGDGEYSEFRELETSEAAEPSIDDSQAASITPESASKPPQRPARDEAAVTSSQGDPSVSTVDPSDESHELATTETSPEKTATPTADEETTPDATSSSTSSDDMANVVNPLDSPDASMRGMTREQMIAIMEARLLGRTPGAPIEKREIKLLIPHKEFQREGPENAIRITFDDIDLLKVLNMEPVPPDAAEYLPEWLKELDGKKIILRGWMYPPLQQEGISRFMFVRDNGICCFGRLPKVYDKLGVTLRNGETTAYIQNRPFDVTGTLRIEPDVDGDQLLWLYRIDDAHVVDH